MKTTFRATVRLENAYPEVADVRVEVKEEPPPELYLLTAAYLGVELPPVVQVEYLAWEPGRKRRVDLKGVTDALLKVETGDALVGCMREWGALFPGKRILLADAMRLVWLFRHFVSARKEGIPVPGPDVKTWTVWPLTVRKARGEETVFSFIPVPAEKGWPLFRQGQDALGEVRRNVLKRLKRVDVAWEGQIVVKPSCLYDALLAAHCLAEPRATVLTTKNKQDAIAFFRTYKNRGKITPEEFEAIKKAITETWDEGEDNPEWLKEVGWAKLETLRNRERGRLPEGSLQQ